MATKAEVEAHISKKLRADKKTTLTGAYVQSAVTTNITTNDWDAIATALMANNFAAAGKRLGQIVRVQVNADSDAEAATYLADNTLSIAEYAEIEGLP